MDYSEVVSGYWRQYHLQDSGDSADRAEASWWAWDEVEQAVSEHRPDLVELLTQLAEAVDGDEAALAYLGAGPFETLLAHADPVSTSSLAGGRPSGSRAH